MEGGQEGEAGEGGRDRGEGEAEGEGGGGTRGVAARTRGGAQRARSRRPGPCMAFPTDAGREAPPVSTEVLTFFWVVRPLTDDEMDDCVSRSRTCGDALFRLHALTLAEGAHQICISTG